MENIYSWHVEERLLGTMQYSKSAHSVCTSKSPFKEYSIPPSFLWCKDCRTRTTGTPNIISISINCTNGNLANSAAHEINYCITDESSQLDVSSKWHHSISPHFHNSSSFISPCTAISSYCTFVEDVHCWRVAQPGGVQRLIMCLLVDCYAWHGRRCQQKDARFD